MALSNSSALEGLAQAAEFPKSSSYGQGTARSATLPLLYTGLKGFISLPPSLGLHGWVIHETHSIYLSSKYSSATVWQKVHLLSGESYLQTAVKYHFPGVLPYTICTTTSSLHSCTPAQACPSLSLCSSCQTLVPLFCHSSHLLVPFIP